MNKFFISLFIVLIVIFGVIFYMIQGKSFKSTDINSTSYQVPTLGEDQIKLQTADGQNQGQQTLGVQAANNQAQTQPALHPSVAPTFGVAAPEKASYSATIKTSKGDIVLTLDAKDAPNTVKNFISKSQSGFYNGLIFHRVEDWVIQGGDPQGNGTGGGIMPTELNQLPFTTGSLGVARGGDIKVSNDSQFFITKSDASWLNGQYTNFGQVQSGMDVVNKIQIGDKILGITVK